MPHRNVVVLTELRRRELDFGWCWIAERGGVRFELAIPDAVLDLLSRHGLSPFHEKYERAAKFYEKLERSARQKLLTSAVGPDKRVVLHESDLAFT